MPHLARITIYPIKSLDGMSVQDARVLPSGALEHDRRFAIVDDEGWGVIGKRTPLVHAIRSRFEAETRRIVLNGESGAFAIDDPSDRQALHSHLSTVLGLSVRLVEAPATGFPDDTEAPGPTVVSEASSGELVGWFPSLTSEEVRRRFRANLEVGGTEPFWEDRLYAEAGSVVRFRIGDVEFEGTNPCQRCVVPSRCSTTGEVIPGFAKTFAGHRQATLPTWADVSRFDHFFRFAVNTQLGSEGGGTIRVGDKVEIIGETDSTTSM